MFRAIWTGGRLRVTACALCSAEKPGWKPVKQLSAAKKVLAVGVVCKPGAIHDVIAEMQQTTLECPRHACLRKHSFAYLSRSSRDQSKCVYRVVLHA